jgi:glycosyltransferase involved in cell wall biosynthesis
MKNPKTLIFFVFPIKFFLSHRLPIAQRAIKLGYKVHLVSTLGKEEKILKKEGIIFHPIKITRSKANPLQELKTICTIFKLYKELKPDIVHHITIKPILYGTLAARLAGINSIVNAFSGLGHVFTAKGFKISAIRTLVKLAYRIILKHRNLVSIVQNHDDMKYLQTNAIISKDQTILIKGSGVDLNEFKYTQEPNGIPVVIFPARLLKDKGVIEFIDAAKILKKQKIELEMVLVGDTDQGNPSSIFQEELNYWVNEKIVSHWGFCNNMPKTLSKANIVCLPSYREGIPKSLMEACATGRAIITTDVPGCREMIDKDQPNGILIPSRNSKKLAAAIQILIKDNNIRKTYSINSRLMAEREFSIDLVVKKTIKIYEKLTA